MESIQIRAKRLWDEEWCLVILFENEVNLKMYDRELLEPQTLLFLNDKTVTIIINQLNSNETLSFRNIPITPNQKALIEGKKVTHISFWDIPRVLRLNDSHCQYANVQYRED